MTELNFQIKDWNGIEWDKLFPKTKAAITLMNDGTTVEQKVTNILNDLSSKVTQSDIDSAIASLVDSSPDTLDTLNELAAALGDDPNFATTITNTLGNKVDKVAGKGLSTEDFTTALKNKLQDTALVTVSDTQPSKGLWFELL